MYFLICYEALESNSKKSIRLKRHLLFFAEHRDVYLELVLYIIQLKEEKTQLYLCLIDSSCSKAIRILTRRAQLSNQGQATTFLRIEDHISLSDSTIRLSHIDHCQPCRESMAPTQNFKVLKTCRSDTLQRQSSSKRYLKFKKKFTVSAAEVTASKSTSQRVLNLFFSFFVVFSELN